MSGNKLLAIGLIGLGIVLLFLGYQSSQGLDDQLSAAVTGNYTDRTVAYWIGGAIAAIAGVVLFLRGR